MKTILWILTFGLCLSARAVTIIPVALSGQAAPGADGARFATNAPFGSFLTINRDGRIAFDAVLQIGESGVTVFNGHGAWHGTPTNLQLMVRRGAPDVFSLAGFSGMDDAGRVAFRAFFTGFGGNDEIIYRSRTNGVLQEIAREGGFIFPDKFLGNNNSILRDTFSEPQLTRDGRVVFSAQFTGSNVTQFNDSAVFALVNPPVQTFFMREGTVLASAGDGSAIAADPQGQASYSFSSSSRAVEVTTTIVTPSNTFEVAVVSLGGGGNPVLLNRTSLEAPGTGLPYVNFSRPCASSAGMFYIARLLNGDQFVIFQSVAFAPSVIARTGNRAPGTTATFFSFGGGFGRAAAAGRHVAFSAGLSGSGVNSSNRDGIWVRRGGSPLRLAVRKGDQAPGMPPGVVFGSDLSGPVINARGQVVFSTLFSGVNTNEFPDTQGAVHALYSSEPDGQLRLIVRAGQQVRAGSNDPRTIRRVGFVQLAGTENGEPTILNDLGQIFCTLDFTDGTTGLFFISTDVISEFSFAPGQPAQVTVGSVAGATYTLEFNPTLNPSGWTTVTSVPGTGGSISLQDPTPSGPRGFYRIRVDLP